MCVYYKQAASHFVYHHFDLPFKIREGQTYTHTNTHMYIWKQETHTQIHTHIWKQDTQIHTRT